MSRTCPTPAMIRPAAADGILAPTIHGEWDVLIEVSSDLRPRINGSAIETAPSIAELHALLGAPSRVVDPGPPAPVGHRNNQIHVYDEIGVEFREHHYTRRIMEGTIVFWPEEYVPEFRPRSAFAGELRMAGYLVSPRPALMDLLNACPIRFRHFIGGILGAKRGGFFVGVDAKGERLPSGRRSKTLKLVRLSFSWPHDDWGRPA